MIYLECTGTSLGSFRKVFLFVKTSKHWKELIKKVQLDATICRHLFTARSLYTFRASQHPSSGALQTVTATSGIGHNVGRATSFQRGLFKTES